MQKHTIDYPIKTDMRVIELLKPTPAKHLCVTRPMIDTLGPDTFEPLADDISTR